MELEEQVRQHKEISLKIEKLEMERKALGLVIMKAMSSKTLQIGGYFVKRFSRLSISTTTEQARPYEAIKLEEVVDKDKIKTLYNNGISIPGLKHIEYIQIIYTNS